MGKPLSISRKGHLLLLMIWRLKPKKPTLSRKEKEAQRGVRQCSFRLKVETIEKLDKLAAETGLSRTAVLEWLVTNGL